MMTISSISSLSDEEVVLLAQNGNSLAEEEIINRYKSYVGYCSSKYYMSGMEKDDIFQEGMIGLYNAIKDYNHPQKSFKNFAILCISRKIISLLKASNRQKHIPLNSSFSLNLSAYGENDDTSVLEVLDAKTAEDPLDTITKKEYYEFIETRIDKNLSIFEKQVLSRYVQGESYIDIATKLNTPVKSIDNAIQRIRKKAMKCLENEE